MGRIYAGIHGFVNCKFTPGKTTVADVKRQVKDATGILIQCQQLKFFGAELKNTHLLKDFNVRNNGGVCIILQLKPCPAAKPAPPRHSVRNKEKAKVKGTPKAAPTQRSQKQTRSPTKLSPWARARQ